MGKPRITNADFCHLHCHTEYSAFDGLNRVQNSSDVSSPDFAKNSLPMLARSMGFKHIAITDHGNVGGIYKFMQECYRKKDSKDNEIPYPEINPILGCEMYLSKDRHVRYEEIKDKKNPIVGQKDGRKGNRHILLLAKNWEGYKNLCRLSQMSFQEGFFYDPRIDIKALADHSNGLICSSACLSSVVNANLLYDRYNQAKKAVALFKDIFKEDFYLEAMYHGIDAEGRIIPDIIKLGREMNVKIVASNDCHYGLKEQGKSQELLMCMSTSRCLTDPKHLHFPYDEFYLKSAEEMYKVFGHYPEMLLNTNEVASKVDSKSILKEMKSGMRLPPYQIPKEFKTPFDYLKHLAYEGMKKIGWDKSEKHVKRLEMEINDIKVAWDNSKLDFATYMLIVRDFIQEARDKNILTGCGRGSVYSSVLSRTIGITYGVDPLEYGLLWERFLGFDTRCFIREEDFGLDTESQNALASFISDESDREVEDDPGGTDRY